MKHLCDRADIIVPNITEAALMLGVDYREPGTYDEGYIRDLAVRLTENGAKTAAITGVRYKDRPDEQGIVAYNRESGDFTEYFHENLPVSFHGTGDLYAAVMFAALILGKPLKDAMRIAATNVLNAIRATMDDPDYRYSVKFELCIPALIRMLGE